MHERWPGVGARSEGCALDDFSVRCRVVTSVSSLTVRFRQLAGRHWADFSEIFAAISDECG
jgi:hypothetical protein